jgi:hypothetical protein
MADVLLYYPGMWLRYLLPFPLGFNFHIILHFYLCAWGTYALGRDLGMSRTAATLAAMAYTLSGPMLALGSMLNVLVAGAWMPVCLLAVRRACAEPTAMRIMVLGLTLGMQAIGGEPLYNIATAAFALPLSGARFGRLFRTLTPAALFGMALIAVQLIPGVELLRRSVRQTSAFTFTESAYWSVHPLNLIELVVPWVMLQNSDDPMRFVLYRSTHPYLMSLYLGPVVLGLAAWALTRVHRPEVKGVALWSAIFVLFSLGWHSAFYTLTYHLIPFVRPSRYPSKMMVVVAFGVALLAAWAADAMLEGRAGPRRWGWLKWPGALAAGWAVRLALTEPAIISWIWDRTLRIFDGPLLVLHLARVAALLAAVALIAHYAGRRPRVTAGLAVALLTGDLILAGYWANPVAPADLFTSRPSVVEVLGSGSREFRIDGRIGMPGRSYPITEGWDPEALSFLEARQSLLWGAPLQGLRDARNISPNQLYTAEFLALRRRLDQGNRQNDFGPLARMNVRYYVFSRQSFQQEVSPPPGVVEVARHKTLTRELRVWELGNWSPRVEMQEGRGSAKVIGETPTRVTVATDSPSAGTLLLRESWDPGWRATVDGVATPIAKTPEIFRAVQVPAGQHTVEFRYLPWSFVAGAAISALAAMAMATLAIRSFLRRKSNHRDTETQRVPDSVSGSVSL